MSSIVGAAPEADDPDPVTARAGHAVTRQLVVMVVLAAVTFLLVVVAHLAMTRVDSAWGAQVSMVIRTVGAATAVAAGVLRLASFVGQRRPSYLIVGVAFLAVGLIESGRVVALLVAAVNEAFTPLAVASRAGWMAGTSLPVLLLLGMALVRPGTIRTPSWRVYAFVGAAVLVSAFGVIGPWFDVVPGGATVGALVARPAVAWAISIYLIMFVFLWRRPDLSGTLDGRWLVFALYLGFLDQTLVAPFWVGIGTGTGTVDAVLKLLTYLVAGAGVLVGTTLIARGQDAAVRRYRAEAEERARVEDELARQAARLTHANEELAQYAYLASHDLQEPLRMVTNYLQLIEKRYGDVLDQDGREFMEFAVDGARRMKRLTNDLLMYSRVGDDEPTGARADAGDAFDAALQNLEVLVAETGAEVTRDDLPVIDMDGVRLTQLFQNLIGNALKFRREDVVPRVHVRATREPQAWHFAVSDNGIGIDDAYRDRVFGVFQRLHGRDAFPGSGIGLAMCRKIVERHGGRIWFDSTLGEGTTFHWTVPTERPAREQDADEPDPELTRRVSGLIQRARELI